MSAIFFFEEDEERVAVPSDQREIAKEEAKWEKKTDAKPAPAATANGKGKAKSRVHKKGKGKGKGKPFGKVVKKEKPKVEIIPALRLVPAIKIVGFAGRFQGERLDAAPTYTINKYAPKSRRTLALRPSASCRSRFPGSHPTIDADLAAMALLSPSTTAPALANAPAPAVHNASAATDEPTTVPLRRVRRFNGPLTCQTAVEERDRLVTAADLPADAITDTSPSTPCSDGPATPPAIATRTSWHGRVADFFAKWTAATPPTATSDAGSDATLIQSLVKLTASPPPQA